MKHYTSLAHGRYATVESVSAAIDGMQPRRTHDYFETGRDRALAGAQVAIALRNAAPESGIRAAWESVRDNAMVNPTQLGAHAAAQQLVHHYPVVREVFVDYGRALPFVRAADHGAVYNGTQSDRTHPELFTGRGLIVAGNDIIVWNRAGAGQAYIDGNWQSVERDRLTHSTPARGLMDIGIPGADGHGQSIHVDNHAPALRPRPGAAAQPHHRERHENIPTHVPHAAIDHLHRQAEDAVRRLDARFGRTYDRHSACMAASLACLARENRLDRIDHVVLSEATASLKKGENVFVVQGGLTDEHRRIAFMKTQDALDTPVARSMERLGHPAPAQVQAVQVAVAEPAVQVRQAPHRMTL